MKNEKAKMPASPRGGHFESADNGGYMLTLHSSDGMGMGAKTVHPSKKHMLAHINSALPEPANASMRKAPGNLIKGPKC